jgi:hypothetical protein
VKLAVFDMLGREVAVIAQGQFAAGSHTVSLKANSLPSGLYLYRMSAAGRTLVRTMSLIK